MNFQQFFENHNSIANLKLASNPRHRTVGALTNGNRQNQSIVATSQKKHNEYESSAITKAKYSGAKTKLSDVQVDSIAKTYGLNISTKDMSKPFELALKQRDSNGVGRYLVYEPDFGFYIQIKKL